MVNSEMSNRYSCLNTDLSGHPISENRYGDYFYPGRSSSCQHSLNSGSFRKYQKNQSVPTLPPPLPDLRRNSIPNFPGNRVVRFSGSVPSGLSPRRASSSGRLQRWGNQYTLNNAPDSHNHAMCGFARYKHDPRYRGEIGSLQQLPHEPISRAPASWYHSMRNLSFETRSSSLICVFCKSNREPPEVYTSHTIRDGNHKVTCPVLRRYKCRFCNATGDNAHTDSYCPQNPNRGHRSSMKNVLQTPVMSSGKKRVELEKK